MESVISVIYTNTNCVLFEVGWCLPTHFGRVFLAIHFVEEEKNCVSLSTVERASRRSIILLEFQFFDFLSLGGGIGLAISLP